MLVGTLWLSPAGNPWILVKNDLFLGLDTAVGAGMIYLVATSQSAPNMRTPASPKFTLLARTMAR